MSKYLYDVMWNTKVEKYLSPTTFQPETSIRPLPIEADECRMCQDWCEENCEGGWEWQRPPKKTTGLSTVTYSWMYFELETDATGFKLRWA